jgi:hypothetical protein
MAENVVDEWFQGGRNAVMLVTSSLHHQDAADPAYADESAQLIGSMTHYELAVTVTWLARMTSQAILDRHAGIREEALMEVRENALALEEAQETMLDGRA